MSSAAHSLSQSPVLSAVEEPAFLTALSLALPCLLFQDPHQLSFPPSSLSLHRTGRWSWVEELCLEGLLVWSQGCLDSL